MPYLFSRRRKWVYKDIWHDKLHLVILQGNCPFIHQTLLLCNKTFIYGSQDCLW